MPIAFPLLTAQIAATAAPADRQVDHGNDGYAKCATEAAHRCKTGARLIMMVFLWSGCVLSSPLGRFGVAELLSCLRFLGGDGFADVVEAALRLVDWLAIGFVPFVADLVVTILKYIRCGEYREEDC
jgi:hypothetical protein